MVSIQTGASAIEDAELEQLLRRVYVDGGFTDPSIADQALKASAVRQRGELFVARAADGVVAGVVIAAMPGSPARRIARENEAEMHLLAVLSEYRGLGIGSKLVEAVVAKARDEGLATLVFGRSRPCKPRSGCTSLTVSSGILSETPSCRRRPVAPFGFTSSACSDGQRRLAVAPFAPEKRRARTPSPSRKWW